MKKELVEILSDVSNNAVIKHPDRNYPGSLIQGDSLNALINEIKEAKHELAIGNNEEASEILNGVLQMLEERMSVYKEALNANNIKLPFSNT